MRKGITYHLITGIAIDLSNLTVEERGLLVAVLRKYQTQPQWTEFGNWWMGEFGNSGLEDSSRVFRICMDLEGRLGVAQGRVDPPDYRDYLSDLIESEYGTRYQFCKATGVDPGHLSRVLASRSDLSLEHLGKLAKTLHAVLVLQPESEFRARVESHKIGHLLARLVS